MFKVNNKDTGTTSDDVRTILQFYNFRTTSHWSLQTLLVFFVCFTLFSSD